MNIWHYHHRRHMLKVLLAKRSDIPPTISCWNKVKNTTQLDYGWRCRTNPISTTWHGRQIQEVEVIMLNIRCIFYVLLSILHSHSSCNSISSVGKNPDISPWSPVTAIFVILSITEHTTSIYSSIRQRIWCAKQCTTSDVMLSIKDESKIKCHQWLIPIFEWNDKLKFNAEVYIDILKNQVLPTFTKIRVLFFRNIVPLSYI